MNELDQMINFGWSIEHDKDDLKYYVFNYKQGYCAILGSLKEALEWTRKNKITG